VRRRIESICSFLTSKVPLIRNLDFRGSSTLLLRYILEEPTTRAVREITICDRPTTLNGVIRFPNERKKIQIEEVDPILAAGLPQTHTSSTSLHKFHAIMRALTTSPLSPLSSHLRGYLDSSGHTGIKSRVPAVYRISEKSLEYLWTDFLKWSLEDMGLNINFPRRPIRRL
jgi:hypothetical protein